MKFLGLIKKRRIKKEAILLLVMIFLLLFFLFQFRVNSKLRGVLKAEISFLQEAKNFEVLKKKHDTLQKELEALQKLLPEQERFSKFLAVLAQIASKTNVKVISIKPLSQRREGPYQEIFVEMDGQGGYHNLGKFLNSLENSSKLFVNVKDFRMKTNPDPKSYKIYIVFTTFGLTEGGESVGKK